MLKHVRASEEWSEKSLGAKGFTLIELLIVIIILGILAGVTIIAIGNMRDNANKNACVNEKDTVEIAVEAFKLDSATGASPASASDLVSADYLKKTPKYWSVSNGALSRTSASAPGCN